MVYNEVYLNQTCLNELVLFNKLNNLITEKFLLGKKSSHWNISQ